MRRLVLVAFVAAALAVLPATASAACPAGAQCGVVTVPLDHGGGTPGTLPLAYAKLPATAARTGTLVFLSGGPGQAAIPLLRDVSRVLRPLRGRYDIVAVDQRGTGESGAIECSTVAECAQRLGDRRAFLTTPETARDLEDLRVALGADKLTLLGVSYGAKVAGEYVRRYPERTAAVVLDSPAPVDGLDGSDELRLLGAPRVLREVCFPGLCHATVSDPGAALAAAARRLQRAPLRGPRVRASGRVSTARVTESDLYDMLVRSDLSPGLRGGLPAAIASLATGDAAPLLHLAEVVPDENVREVNGARLLATACVESRLPWTPESSVASREGAVAAFVAARRAAFAPFSAATVLESAVTGLCAAWPPTPRTERVAYPGPDVPVLVISGRDDLRTPLEDARRTAAQYPHATLLAVPSVGHSVLRSDASGCAAAGLVAFLGGAPVRPCASGRALTAAPYAPATIARLRPTRLTGLPGRTLAAVNVTLTGVAFDASTQARPRFRLPGLRRGYVVATRSALELHGVEWIQGVRVTGRIDARGRGTLRVSGPAPGAVVYTGRGGRATLGGRTVTLGDQ